MSNVLAMGALELAAAIAAGDASSEAVVAAHLARIEAVNGVVHAVTHLDAERAMAAAKAADERRSRGEVLGPLHGVPFTCKDWIEAEGLPFDGGFEARAAVVGARDATVVARMRAAGAVLLGKTVTVDGAPLHPRPNNPHDLARSPGASSSGEAAIIAAGGSPLGLGSDSGGSLRLPAHCCGVPTLKPSTGRVPCTGHWPPVGALSDPRTVIGPFGRRIEDLAASLAVIAGPDGRDPAAAPVPLGGEIGPLRIAWFAEMAGATPTAETVAAVEACAAALAGRGHSVEAARPDHIDDAWPVTRAYWKRPVSLSLNSWRPDRPFVLSAAEIEESVFLWERLQRSLHAFMGRFDILLTPVAAGPARLHGHADAAEYLYTLPYSLTGQPAAVVPWTTSPEGLPIGVQVIGARWADHVVLKTAAALEAAGGAWRAAILHAT